MAESAKAGDASKAGRVTVVGSLNMDLVARAPRLPKPGETLAGHAFAQVAGGKGGNQAVAAARLGAQVAMIGCVGDDSNGAILKRSLEAEGIDCSALATSASAPTGVALIVVDDASQNAIVIVAGSNAQVTPASVEAQEALLAGADVIVCQLETPSETVRAALAAGRRLGRTTILNPAPAARKLPPDWFPLIDYLIPNELEAGTLSGVPIETPADARRAAQALKAKGVRNVIVTLGSQGVLALLDGADEAGAHLQSPRVEAIDTTAAGDTFIGGFAAELARGATPLDAITFGQRAAAIAVTREGAQPSIPHRSEISA
jgi:ribokinase